jgi:hypothetical protein
MSLSTAGWVAGAGDGGTGAAAVALPPGPCTALFPAFSALL